MTSTVKLTADQKKLCAASLAWPSAPPAMP